MDEYIKKDTALMQLTGINLPTDIDEYISLVNNRLMRLNATDVAPVIHAKWIKIGTYSYPWNCSNCDGYSRAMYDYCPNCGARKCTDAMDRCVFIGAVLEAPTIIEAEDCEEPHLDEWAEHCHKIADNDCDKPSGNWIPLIRREPTEEEKAEYLEQYGEKLCYMLDNRMPFHGESVLVSVDGNVYEDIFDEDFFNFENDDIENVDAWMPKPKPYENNKEGRE